MFGAFYLSPIDRLLMVKSFFFLFKGFIVIFVDLITEFVKAFMNDVSDYNSSDTPAYNREAFAQYNTSCSNGSSANFECYRIQPIGVSIAEWIIMYIGIKVKSIFEAEGIGGEPSADSGMVEAVGEEGQPCNLAAVGETPGIGEVLDAVGGLKSKCAVSGTIG